jgi:hypothetical protein
VSKAVRLARSNDKGIGFSGFRDLDMSVQIHKVGVRYIITRVVHLMLFKLDKFSLIFVRENLSEEKTYSANQSAGPLRKALLIIFDLTTIPSTSSRISISSFHSSCHIR